MSRAWNNYWFAPASCFDLAVVRMIRPQPCEQVQGDLDTGQRIVDLVDNNGRHLADHRQPRGVVHRRFRRTQPFD